MIQVLKIMFPLFACLFIVGCVERMITVTSKPPGALVWLNGQEVGSTPVTTGFTWYGKYDVAIRKETFETVRTSRETPVPIYQWPGLDFLSEALLPMKLVDRHNWHFNLSPQEPAKTDDLIGRAQNLREQIENHP